MTWTWRHVLYRLHDADGALLYVGITNDVAHRFGEHAAHRPWWSDVAGCTVEFHPDRDTLEQAERDAIRSEHPRHNVTRYTIHEPRPRRGSDGGWESRRRNEEQHALNMIVDDLVEWHNPFVQPKPDAEWSPGHPRGHPDTGDVILGTWETPFHI